MTGLTCVKQASHCCSALPGQPSCLLSTPIPHPAQQCPAHARAQRPCSPVECMYIRCLKCSGPFGQARTCVIKQASQCCSAPPGQLPCSPHPFHRCTPCQPVHRPSPSPATMQSHSVHVDALAEAFGAVLLGRNRQGTFPSTAVSAVTCLGSVS